MAKEKSWAGDGVPLKDSNCAGIGTAEDKALRKKAAGTEAAWRGAGETPGISVWRIENFQVVPWDKSKYGKFHSGDSYIILESVKVDRQLERHIYFWLGESSSPDEMGTAAYKTVELDDYFRGSATQSREVQGKESKQFRGLFPKITYLEGGVDSGFHHVESGNVFEARLFRVRKIKGGVVEQEVTLARSSLNEGDCFVLDTGSTIYIWHGSDAAPLEKYEANIMAERLEGGRDGHAVATRDLDDEFWRLLGGKGPIKPASEGVDRVEPPDLGEGVLFKLFAGQSNKLDMHEVGRRVLDKSMLDSNHVMILDHGSELFIWVGSGADDNERKGAWRIADNFLKMNNRNTDTPVHLYKDGHNIKNKVWNSIFGS